MGNKYAGYPDYKIAPSRSPIYIKEIAPSRSLHLNVPDSSDPRLPEQPDYEYPMTINYEIHKQRIAEENLHMIGHELMVEKVITNKDGSISLVCRIWGKDEMTSSERFLERFDKRNRELRQLLKDKGSDYSGDEDRHRNFKLVHFITCGKPIVITPLVSCLIRQLDKIQRAFNLLLSGKANVKGETMKDTLKDNTGYANIAEDIWELEEK